MPPMTLENLALSAGHSEIASMGAVVNRIIEVIKSPRSNAMDLKGLIELDPALSGVILRRANSPYYSMKRKLTNILDAIVCLGFDTVKELALSQKISQMFKQDTVVFGYSRQLLWVHSLAVALSGKLIFRREYRLRGDDIYTAGILHDLGIMIMDQFLKAQYHPVLEQVFKEKVNLREAERRLLGFTHEELGMRLMQSWNLPADFCRVIGYAERPSQAAGEEARLAKTLYICNVACQAGGLGYVENPQEDREAYLRCLEEQGLSEMAIELIMDEVKLEIERMREDGWFS